ncbi:MAG: hydroxysqualene dehydroxylase HpnE [Polaromonas sp.]|jgi:squalene-associated FAD-dependent desaturase
MKVAVIGAGWAGCAAAVEATRLGHQATVFEAARTAGGRARRLDIAFKGETICLDNGQHILIGAYSETLKLMADMGIDLTQTLHRMPLTMQLPNGNGLKLPSLPAPLDALVGIALARGWSWGDKLSLLKTAAQWHLNKFQCAPQQSVADVCSNISLRVMASLIEPLCVSALNTPADRASGQVFLRVLRDSLFAPEGGSNLLLPKTDLSALLPDAALAWVARNGGRVQLGCRVNGIILQQQKLWHLTDASDALLGQFDSVILACPPLEAARLARSTAPPCPAWLDSAEGLQYEAIATVYAHAPGAHLAQPMLALPSSSHQPAQFVFDRGQLGGPAGLLAFVVSASQQSSTDLAAQVVAQAADQLGFHDMAVLQTVLEKRATFACTPGLQRPAAQVAPGLLACGDYIDGPYPATLEGAVRSGLQAAALLERPSVRY